MDDKERIQRAEEARRIIESPVFKSATEGLLLAIRSLRLQVSPRDTDGSHKLVLMEQTVERTQRALVDFMQDGAMARAAMDAQAAEETDTSITGKIVRKFRQVI